MGAPVGGDQDAISDINIVPLVDIILVVLIIFMVTAPASQSGKVEVDLPSAASGDAAGGGQEPLNVILTAEGRMLVDGENISEGALQGMASEAARQDPNAQAIITADKNLPHGDVVKVMDLIKTAGINKLSVSTTQSLED